MQFFGSRPRRIGIFEFRHGQHSTIGPTKATSFQSWINMLLLVTVWSISGCCPEASDPSLSNDIQKTSDSANPARKLFTDVTTAVGLSFVHRAGDIQSDEFPRSMGSGCAWLDANGDNRLDMLFVNGGEEIDIGNIGQM